MCIGIFYRHTASTIINTLAKMKFESVKMFIFAPDLVYTIFTTKDILYEICSWLSFSDILSLYEGILFPDTRLCILNDKRLLTIQKLAQDKNSYKNEVLKKIMQIPLLSKRILNISNIPLKLVFHFKYISLELCSG